MAAPGACPLHAWAALALLLAGGGAVSATAARAPAPAHAAVHARRALQQQPPAAARAYLADAPAARAFCESPGFATLKCGWASEAELKATAAHQCDGWPLDADDAGRCSAAFKPVPDELPMVLEGDAHGRPARRGRALSLACRGRVSARGVFKVLDAGPPGGGGNGGGVRLEGAGPAANSSSSAGSSGGGGGLVRCKLRLPAGPEPEATRALRAAPAACAPCGAGGCPALKVGAWYSDTRTALASGCGGNFGGGYQVRLEGAAAARRSG
jgi:hypothetical protein